MARERDIALSETVGAYIALTKPRITEFSLVAATPAILQADRGHVHAGLILLTLFGGWMGVTAARTFNMVMDYNIDQKMRRTRRRPPACNQVSRRAAAIFGAVLTTASVLWLWLLCNSLLTVIFILITIAFYIFVYTLRLKRRTDQNVIWGGAVGCIPVMVGWAVITDNSPETTELVHWWQIFILFLLILLRILPHIWVLGLRYKEDYKVAGVPVMSVVKSVIVISKRIIYYTAATVITILLLVPYAGWIYLIGAVGAGAWFLWGAIDLYRHVKTDGKIRPMRLFFMSNSYLSIACVAPSLDVVLRLQIVSSMFQSSC